MKTMQIDHFDKYAFIKAFVGNTKNEAQRKEREREALIIAEAIEKNEKVLLENLVTKKDLKKDLALLEQKLIIKLTVIMATLLTVLPLFAEFLKRSF